MKMRTCHILLLAVLLGFAHAAQPNGLHVPIRLIPPILLILRLQS